MRVIVDLGIMSRGHFVTKYSQWNNLTFATKKEARIFGKGVVCGLEYKWKNAACQLCFEGGSTEVIM